MSRFVVTSSGKIGDQCGVLDVEKAAAALGKICRYAGNCKSFWSVLLHSMVVSDLAPDNIKLLALIHDISETAISDVPTPFKVPELEHIEKEIQKRLYDSLGLDPTADDLAQLRIADRRALTGEVWVLGQNELHSFFPLRDHYAEELVLQYNILYTPVDSIISDGKAVTEFLKRFRKLRSKNVTA
jgi:hypothetical protein